MNRAGRILRCVMMLALFTAGAAREGRAAAGPACESAAASFRTSGQYDFKKYGNYILNNNNWNNTAGQTLWADGPNCWGVTTTATSERYGIGSYPSITRGWTQNEYAMRVLSRRENDWTAKAGMGIPVGSLKKARVHWAFNAPPAPNRWNALMDIYFHKTNAPPPVLGSQILDLMVDQALVDQVNKDGTTYYGAVAARNHATQVTIGGNTYTVYVDNPEQKFNAPGGHTIEMFNLPTAFAGANDNPTWGSTDAVTDVAAIIKYWMQPNPLDDAGKPVLNGAGAPITAPLITPDMFLSVINAGFEIDFGTAFTTTAFCVAVQDEPDCQ